MMRHDQHRGGKRLRITRHERQFAGLFDIAGQQYPATRRIDTQHAGARVVAHAGLHVAITRVQHRETHAVPLPVLAGATGVVTVGATSPAYVELLSDRLGAAHMVVIAMADHQLIDGGPPYMAQIGHHERIAGIEPRAISRPGVVDERMAPGPDHNGQPLPHVQHRQPQAARGDLMRGRTQADDRRQQKYRGQPAPGQTARHGHKRDADECQHQRHHPVYARVDTRPGPVGKCGQPRPGPVQRGRNGRQCRATHGRQQQRGDGGKQQDRHEHHCRGNEYRIDQGRNKRSLAEEPGAQRRQSGHQPQLQNDEAEHATPCGHTTQIDQPRDRAERKPEARRNHRHRSPEHNHDRRQCEYS